MAISATTNRENGWGVWVIVVVIGENTEDNNKAYIILNVRNYKSRRFRIF